MSTVLLDTHILYWLVSGEALLLDAALVAIGKSQETNALYVSPVTAWELALASTKARIANRPNLGDRPPGVWFRSSVRELGARTAPIDLRVSCEAAQVAIDTGHKDPGDCFLMATARVRRLSLITRDVRIHSIAAERANYLAVVAG